MKKSGWKGSGAYTKSECLTGSKSMPKEHMKMPQGRMSSAHAVVPNGGTGQSRINYNDALGSDCPTFKNGPIGEAGKK